MENPLLNLKRVDSFSDTLFVFLFIPDKTNKYSKKNKWEDHDIISG